LVFRLGAVMKIVHISLFMVYVVALMAMRFNDPIKDPWHHWQWVQFAISTTLIVPVFLADMLKTTYDISILFSAQALLTCCWALWGFFHSILLTIAFTNCNDAPGGTPEYPYCINRYYPEYEVPDFSMYCYWICIISMTGCCVFWVWFGYRLRMASLALEWASNAAAGIMSKMQRPTPSLALAAYHEHIGDLIGDGLSKNAQRVADGAHQPEFHPAARYIDRIAGAHVYNALVNAQSSRGQLGTGVPVFSQYVHQQNPGLLDHVAAQLGDNIHTKLKAHSTHIPLAITRGAYSHQR